MSPQMQGFTYNKTANVSIAAGETVPASIGKEIDLGLGVDQVARILAIDISAKSGTECGQDGYQRVRATVYTDPEEVVGRVYSDDEIIAFIEDDNDQGAVALGPFNRGRQRFLDFTNMNVITSRNLGFGVTIASNIATHSEGEASVNVWYEKVVPSANELNRILARRYG